MEIPIESAMLTFTCQGITDIGLECDETTTESISNLVQYITSGLLQDPPIICKNQHCNHYKDEMKPDRKLIAPDHY